MSLYKFVIKLSASDLESNAPKLSDTNDIVTYSLKLEEMGTIVVFSSGPNKKVKKFEIVNIIRKTDEDLASLFQKTSKWENRKGNTIFSLKADAITCTDIMDIINEPLSHLKHDQFYPSILCCYDTIFDIFFENVKKCRSMHIETEKFIKFYNEYYSVSPPKSENDNSDKTKTKTVLSTMVSQTQKNKKKQKFVEKQVNKQNHSTPQTNSVTNNGSQVELEKQHKQDKDSQTKTFENTQGQNIIDGEGRKVDDDDDYDEDDNYYEGEDYDEEDYDEEDSTVENGGLGNIEWIDTNNNQSVNNSENLEMTIKIIGDRKFLKTFAIVLGEIQSKILSGLRNKTDNESTTTTTLKEKAL